MRRSVALAFGVAGVLAGCSSDGAEKEPVPVTAAPTTAAPTTAAVSTETTALNLESVLKGQGFARVTDNTLGNVWFGFAENAQKDLAAVQYSVGATANKLLIAFESVPVSVDGQIYDATFSIPDEAVIRAYGIYPDTTSQGGSNTDQTLTPLPNGQFKLENAIGIIGQENGPTGPALIVNVVTELCQGLDMTVKTPGGVALTDEVYLEVKEGACNSLGYAADRSFSGVGYEAYKAEFSGQFLGNNASHGAKVQYTIIDPTTYGRFTHN